MTEAQLREAVAVNTDNITRLFAEQERFRIRLHTLESDRATVLLLAQKVDDLAKSLPAMVERAAETAAEKVDENHKADWRTWAALAGATVAVLGFLFTVGLHVSA